MVRNNEPIREKLKEYAEELGIEKVRKYLSKCKIPFRHYNPSALYKLPSGEDLERMYIKERKTMDQIAELYSVPKNSIEILLRSCKFPSMN